MRNALSNLKAVTRIFVIFGAVNAALAVIVGCVMAYSVALGATDVGDTWGNVLVLHIILTFVGLFGSIFAEMPEL